MRRQIRRNGLSLIELVVVIGVIAVLMALILPAVQSAREAARRIECKNRLKQIGLALHNYHDTHRVFPLNYGNGSYDGTNTGASWMQMILPMLDQGSLYSQIQFGQPLDEPANRGVAETVVVSYLCPSDGGNGGKMEGRSNVAGPLAVTNYLASSGSNWAWGRFSPFASSRGRNAGNHDGLDHCNGFICRGGDNQPTLTRIVDIQDGTSTTFAVGETVPDWSSHAWWYWFNGSTATCAIPLNHKRVPETSLGDWHEHNGFKSQHTGGGSFAMADGSVRFVSENINRRIYRNLATIQGGEIVNDF